MELEERGLYGAADRVMTLLLDCNPKEGSHCEKATSVGTRVKKL